MDYSFNGKIAEMYGVDEAVFIHNLFWWISKNKANGKHFYDGRCWTYNSAEAFAQLFPFWTRRQIERIIKKLREAGAISIGNYNPVGFDRTQWYALSESVVSIYANGEMDLPERCNAFTQTGKPIPDSKPDINTDSKPDIYAGRSFSSKMQSCIDSWLTYKEEKRQSYKPTGLNSFLSEVENKLKKYSETDVLEVMRSSMASNYQGIVWDRLKGKELNQQSGNLFAQRAREMRDAQNGS